MLPEELHKVAVVEQEKQRQFHRSVEVCIAAGCLSLRSAEIKDALAKELKQRQQEKRCAVVGVGCMGLCSAGPLVCVRPEGTIYRDVPLEGVGDIIRSLDDGAATGLASLSDLPFLQRQRRIVLESISVTSFRWSITASTLGLAALASPRANASPKSGIPLVSEDDGRRASEPKRRTSCGSMGCLWCGAGSRVSSLSAPPLPRERLRARTGEQAPSGSARSACDRRGRGAFRSSSD